MARKPLIALGASAAALVIVLIVFMMNRDGSDDVTPVADATATAAASPSATPTSTEPTVEAIPTKPAPVVTTVPAPATKPAPVKVTNPNYAAVTVSTAQNFTGARAFSFDVSQIRPVDSVVSVRVAVVGDGSSVTTLQCTPHPKPDGTCSMLWSTKRSNVTVGYTVQVESSDATYTSPTKSFYLN